MAETKTMGGKISENKVKIEPSRVIIKKDMSFFGEKDTYDISASQIVAIGGESQIFIAKKQSDGSRVLAKIYTKFEGGHIADENRQEIIKFLEKNSDYTTTHILPLLDSGYITIENAKGNSFTHPIEILPQCPNGHLGKCTYEVIKSKILPSILAALQTMHKEKLVHRDIKPENIYLYNDEYVLGDFGIAGFVYNDNTLDTSLRRGTVGYAAPEISNGFIIPETDCYALGCTLATLYNGSHVFSEILTSDNPERVVEAISKNGLPLDCPEEEKDFQLLVDALTIYDYKSRAGLDDVNLWLNNIDEFVSKWSNIKTNSKNNKVFEYTFMGKKYIQKDSLTKAFVENWNVGKEVFFDGGIYNSEFQHKLISQNQACAFETGKILKEQENASNKHVEFNDDLGFAKMLHFFNADESSGNKCPIYWCGYQFDTLDDLAIKMSDENTDKAVFKDMLICGFLSWKLEHTTAFSSQDTLNIIKNCEMIACKYPSLAYYSLMYKLLPDNYYEKTTPDEIFAKISFNNGEFYSAAKDFLENEKFLAQLISIGYEKKVMEFKENISSDFLKDVTELYKFFEGICDNKKRVREHYINYGPLSYAYWIKQNINKYNFNSAGVKNRIADKIISSYISSEMQIGELEDTLDSLAWLCGNLFVNFQNDILLRYIEMDNGKEVVSDDIDAYFKENFYGTKVPVGYMRYMNLQSKTEENDSDDNSSYNPNSNGNEGVVWKDGHYRFTQRKL